MGGEGGGGRGRGGAPRGSEKLKPLWRNQVTKYREIPGDTV